MDNDEIFNEDYLSSLIDAGEPVLPPADQAEVMASAQQLNESIKTFKEGETVYGPQPETFQQAKPKQEAAVEAIKDMTSTYADESAPEEAKKEKKDKATGIMQEQADFFKGEYEKILERDRKMQVELDAIRQQLEIMKQMMQSYNPEAIAKCVQDGMQFINNVENFQQNITAPNPTENVNRHELICAVVSDIYKNIREQPGKLKEAIKEKAYDQADKALKCIAGWFDKGIKYTQTLVVGLEAKKQSVLNMSPKRKKVEIPKKDKKKQALAR